MSQSKSYDRYLQYRPFRQFNDLDAFLQSESLNGVVQIGYGAGQLDMLIDDRGAPITIVVFHGAFDLERITLPVFAGLNLVGGLNVNLISVSDPTLELGAGLGWFAGDNQRDLQTDLVTVLTHIATTMKGHENFIFFGPSGGGFAALFYATRFPGSLAMPINPQTNIHAYIPSAFENYVNAAWEGKAPTKGAVLDLNGLYSRGVPNCVLYLQNLGDRPHVRQHLLPFLDSMRRGDVRYELSLNKWGFGHRAPSRAAYRPILTAAVSCRGNWANLFGTFLFDSAKNNAQILQLETSYLNQIKKQKSHQSIESVQSPASNGNLMRKFAKRYFRGR